MSEKIWLRVIRGGSGLVAMVLIWRLVEAALRAGIDGALFFIGVAAIAGLGGYELRWVVDVIKARLPGGGNQGSGS
ncbi:unnamed protein product [marine sediment metagenome]|uniref:Uncharacterized protein n=1 Tax=marine sediment metagenome TaxID=412755 RepID=X1SWE4_9ZZZZ